MTNPETSAQTMGLSLRQAAYVAGLGLLIMVVTAPVAEFYFLPQAIVDGDMRATQQNLLENPETFLMGAFGHFITLTADIFVAWGLFVLMRPAGAAFSLLTAWFRLVYTAIAFVGLFNLLTAFRILTSTSYGDTVGADALYAQAQLLMTSSDEMWNLGLVIFGGHLFLLGLLILKSRHIPRLLGPIVSVAGAGYIITNLGAYITPEADLGFLFITFFGEIVFMLWLLLLGWRIKDPAA
jgi:hypothetical protein